VRLASRLAIGLTATSALVLGGHGYVQLQQEKADLREMAEQELRLLGTALQVAVENALRDQQAADVREILDSLEVRDASLDVFVFDRHGQVDVHSWGSHQSRAAATVAVADLDGAERPLLRFEGPEGLQRLVGAFSLHSEEGAGIGGLVVVKPLDHMRADLKATRWSILLSMTSQVGAISLVGWLLVLLYVRRPLLGVVQGMRAIRAGDLTTRVTARRRDEVAEVAHEFNQMVADLEQTRRQLASETESRRTLEAGLQRVDKLVTVGQLSAGLAHEIGSPLQILNGRARALLARSDASPEIRRNAQILVAESDRVARIVEQLLRFARRRALHLGKVDLGATVRAVIDLLEFEARRRRIAMSFEAPSDLPLLRADADQLQQVVLNLVTNALKATPPGGGVRVSLAPACFCPGPGGSTRASLALTIADTGVGMDEVQALRAFEPFFTNWPDAQGTGLGLAVVKAIVGDHGGAVDLTSRPGEGTRVTVHIPLPGSPNVREEAVA
jgi:signal transduction histidine kinase